MSLELIDYEYLFPFPDQVANMPKSVNEGDDMQGEMNSEAEMEWAWWNLELHLLTRRGKSRSSRESLCKCYRKWGPAACCLKANEEARLVERKICFISRDLQLVRRADSCQKADSSPPIISGQKLLKGSFQGVQADGGDCKQKQHSQLWQSSWNWSFSGLTSVILVVLSTVHFQFQNQFVPIALRPVLGIVAA